jgi:type I restriction enzyme S subunit
MKTRKLPREWLYCLLSSADFSNNLSTMVTGTSGSHQRVRPEALLAMQVLAPPEPVATSFAGIAGPLVSRAARCLDESQTLAAIRDALLPKLISGELRVVDAGRPVEQTA